LFRESHYPVGNLRSVDPTCIDKTMCREPLERRPLAFVACSWSERKVRPACDMVSTDAGLAIEPVPTFCSDT
jgi:hypothetical protein